MQTGRWWLMAALLALAPFSAFLITWGRSLAGDSAFMDALSMWREVLALGIGLLIILELAFKGCAPWAQRWFSLAAARLDKTRVKFEAKVAPFGRAVDASSLRFDLLDFAVAVYALISFIWLIFQRENPRQWLLGFRFDVAPVIFFALVRRVDWPAKRTLVGIALGAATFAMIFGLLQAAVLPQNFLERFGYSSFQGQYAPEIPIAGCQYLEHTNRFCRAISTFGGPTRYGVYLMVVIGLLAPLLATSSPRRKFAFGLALLAFLNIALTYSRSVWIGAAAMLLIFGAFWMKKISRKTACAILISISALILAGFLAFKNLNLTSDWKTILMRETSTGEHAAFLKQGAKTVLENPWGIGLGKAGPASVHFQKFLTENWFLQIAVEMGVAGLLAFLAVLVLFSRKMLAAKHWTGRGLFVALIGISTAGLFTHSFEETSAVLILFGLAGAISRED